MRKPVVLFLAFSILAWAACDTEPPTQPVDIQPAFVIQDAAHNGTPGFYWLPPMVTQPATTGAFIGTLSPEVEVCRLNAAKDDCDGPPLVRFTRSTGIEVDVHGQHYQVNWQTDAAGVGEGGLPAEPIGAGDYRIAVVLDGKQLGIADIVIADNGSTFKTLAGDVIALIDGRTLPIKFRIEFGVLAEYGLNIAYHSTRDADSGECPYNFDVFLASATDGQLNHQLNLTGSPGTMDGTPSWSPDGTKIVFASDRANACGSPDLYIMDLVYGTVDRLTRDGGWKPAWSPDGQWIAFQRGWPPESVAQNIWIIPAAGGTEIQLTDPGLAPGEDPCEDIDPAWHPSLMWVTFSRQANVGVGGGCPNFPPPVPISNFAVFSVDVSDPASPLWIRHTGFNLAGYPDQISPKWSPDPKLVAQVETDPGDLWVLTGGVVQLTSNPDGDDQNPSWAPNDNEVVFTSFRNGDWGIYYVPDWSVWLSDGVALAPSPLVVESGVTNAWARFRPGT